MPDQPHILFLTHRVPHPPNRGDRIRSWHMLRFLSERANVHLGCLTDEPVSDASLQELDRVCERVAIQPLSGAMRWVQGGWSLLKGRSATEGLFQSPRLKQTIREWARDTKFDAALVFCSSMFQFVKSDEFAGIPVVVDLVDVDSEKWRNYAESATFAKSRLYHLEASRVRKLELEIAREVKAVTLVSEEEVKVFRTFCDTDNVHAISNGVDLDYFHPAPSEYKRAAGDNAFKLIFVGVLDYRANIEGLRWFCNEVWPKVREQIPGIELDLVGRRPGDAARQFATLPGIKLIGEVEDVRPSVWKADVVIAPLTIARGIQNKVLEAMAMTKPIIATPQAVEGTGAIGGEHLISAGSVNAWLSALVKLSGSQHLRSKFAQAARSYVLKQHTWEGQLASLAEHLGIGPSSASVADRDHCDVHSAPTLV